MPIKIGLIGKSGNIGKLLKETISENKNFEYSGGISTNNATSLEYDKLCRSSKVVIDFSNPETIDMLLLHAIDNDTSLVIGTTGYSNFQHEKILSASKKIPIFYSSNFSLGMQVVKELLKILASCLSEYSINLLEWHREKKKDSPSGTALSLINEIKKHTTQQIKTTSIRAGDAVCEHSLYFTNKSERITLKHEIHNRKAFAYTALDAAMFILSQKSGYYEMKDLIGELI